MHLPRRSMLSLSHRGFRGLGAHVTRTTVMRLGAANRPLAHVRQIAPIAQPQQRIGMFPRRLMAKASDVREISRLIAELKESAISDACWTCECLHAFLTQLELDREQFLPASARELAVPRSHIHGCLGCKPCPPAELYSEYLTQESRKRPPILAAQQEREPLGG